MTSRKTKPIRLKATGRRRAHDVSNMLEALESKAAPESSEGRRTPGIWTQEFLASGKPGKATG